MLATTLIVVMILLQTGALALGVMIYRRLIAASLGWNRHRFANNHNRKRP